jgi:Glycosyltransferases, probably involved in cell wall biogenesis
MVSIITCTMRPNFMNRIFRNYERQLAKNKELIIILNRDSMDLAKWRKRAKNYRNVRVYQVPEKWTLGKCLNYGIRKAKHRLIAKFDDDDYYAPAYLKESLRALAKKKASIVGKNASYVYFEEKKALMLYREGGEKKYRKRLKGGTLVFRKSVWEKVKFDERRPNGSDQDFLRRCRKRGYRVYSVSKYNYVCIRRKNIRSHTQKTKTKEYMARCKMICRTQHYIPIITRKV